MTHTLAELSEMFAVPSLLLDDFVPQAEATRLLCYQLAERLRVIPLSRVDGVLSVVTDDPCNVVAIDHVRSAIGGLRVEVCATTKESLDKNLRRFYGLPLIEGSNEVAEIEVRYSVEHEAAFNQKSADLVSNALNSEHVAKSVVRRTNVHHGAWYVGDLDKPISWEQAIRNCLDCAEKDAEPTKDNAKKAAGGGGR